jgi:hypothetical protein
MEKLIQHSKSDAFTFFINLVVKIDCPLTSQRNNCALSHALQLQYKNSKRFCCYTSSSLKVENFTNIFMKISTFKFSIFLIGLQPKINECMIMFQT